MMMSKADENSYSAADRMIYEARERLQLVRDRYWRERVQGEPSPKVRRELAIAALQLFDVLWEYRGEQVVREDWEDSSIGELHELLNETVSMPKQAAGDTTNAETVDRPAIMAVPSDELIRMTKDLDELAKELGFGANTASQLPFEDWGE